MVVASGTCSFCCAEGETRYERLIDLVLLLMCPCLGAVFVGPGTVVLGAKERIGTFTDCPAPHHLPSWILVMAVTAKRLANPVSMK